MENGIAKQPIGSKGDNGHAEIPERCHSGQTGIWIVQSKESTSAENAPENSITAAEYRTFQQAYNHLNEHVFEGRLPQVLITFQRCARARGYFSAKRFQHRGDDQCRVHEIALNPDTFIGRTDMEILSTLCHEMAHVWQGEFGHPGRGRYHNREWASKMFSVGLMPSATGEPGGAITGESVSHYILPGGAFATACVDFVTKYRLVWESAVDSTEVDGLALGPQGPPVAPAKGPVRKRQTRAKFSCPNCDLNAWAKPRANILCGDCTEETRENIPLLLCGGNSGGDAKRKTTNVGANPATQLTGNDDCSRAFDILTDALRSASNARIPKQAFIHGLVDFTAAVALGFQGEDLLRAVITGLEQRIRDFQAGTFPVGNPGE